MALPKIDLPLYTTEIPSTGEKVKFRPFLVKEEKILLMALESGEPENINDATMQIIQNCVPDAKLDVISSYDVEWLFLQIRRRSIGERTTLRFRHKDGKNSKGEECKNLMQVDVDLSEVEVHGETKPPVIHLTDTVGMKMRYPTMQEAFEIAQEDGTQVDRVLNTVAKCIDVIFDGDEVFPAKSSTQEELMEFLEGLNTEQFQKVQTFFIEIPRLYKKITHQCEKCGDMITHEVEGLSSFFA